MEFLRSMYARPALVFSGLALVIAVLFWRDAGRGWDDGTDQAWADAVWTYYASGGETWKVPETDGGVMKNYGTLNGLFNAAWHQGWGLKGHEQRPWVHAWFWIATFAPVVWTARALGGRFAAWMVGLALLAAPRYFGEAFVNAKDLPLACGIAWCLWGATMLGNRERARWWHFAAAGGTIALALTARPAALFAFGPLIIATGWLAWRERREDLRARAWGRLGALAMLAAVIAAGLAYAAWPTVLEEGPGAWVRAVNVAKAFVVGYPVLYLGETHQSTALPWHYPFVYLAITTPLPALALGLAGLAVTAWRLRRIAERAWAGGASLLALFAFPFVAFLALKPNMYDGIRHFLFLTPLLAVAAGVAVAAAVEARAGRAWRIGAGAAGALVLAWGLRDVARMHPYQLTYFNALAGPAETVHERFETDYWVLSYREAAEWINARQRTADRPLRVVVAANGISVACFAPYLDPRVQFGFGLGTFAEPALPEPFDYYIAMVRYGQARNFPQSPVVHRIERGGILLSVIRGREGR